MTKRSANLKTQPTLFVQNRLPENGSGDQRAAFRRIRNFLAGRFVGATRDEALLAEVLKCLHCKTFFERNPNVLDGFDLTDLAESDSTRLALLCRQAFRHLKSEFPDFFSDADELLLDPAALAVVMREIASLPLLDANRDPIGDAFETFIGSSVRGQDGQFFTPRNAAQFLIRAVQPLLSETIIDPACGAGGFLTATLQHFFQRGAAPSELAQITERQLFGIDKDAYLASLARTHLALVANACPNVACADSLAWSNGNQLDGFPPVGEYDVVLTNPPFGARIVAAEAAVLRSYSLARKWRARSDTGEFVQTTDINDSTPPQVLFIERCVGLVKPGGRIGMVVPESLLSSKSYRHVIQFIRAACDVLLVAGMPESLFKTSGKGGTHTKTCLLVLHKHNRANNRRPQLFMAEAKWCGHDSRGKPIPHDDLPTIADNYRAFQETGTIDSPSPLGFALEQSDITDNILAPRFYDPNLTGALDRLRDTHQLVTMRELVSVGAVELRTGDEVGKLTYGTGPIPFIRTSDLSNWEIKIDPKHGLSREIYQRYRDKQDVRTGDILFVRDGTYLIGTCALITEHDTEIVYQSHLYKIRVRDNDFGLDPYLLLAILSSDVVQAQIKSKRFTQDIIDSLGDRILDLVLPIPKSAKWRAEISDMVRKVIADRVEARELSRLARRRVVEPRSHGSSVYLDM